MGLRYYLDTSAVLRGTLDGDVGMLRRIQEAEMLITSRLSLVESSRTFGRTRLDSRRTLVDLVDAERAAERIWGVCQVYELDRNICERARSVAPSKALRSLDALHLATFLEARKQVEALELLTFDQRLRAALEGG